jgi:hypothetical protein
MMKATLLESFRPLHQLQDIEKHNRGEKGNKMAWHNVRIYWTGILSGVSRRPSLPCQCQFQIKLEIKFQIGDAGDGALEWFVQMANG